MQYRQLFIRIAALAASAAALTVALAAPTLAQNAEPGPRIFRAVGIKLSSNCPAMNPRTASPVPGPDSVRQGAWDAGCKSLANLIYRAYNLPFGPGRVAGLPAWNDTTLFDIDALTVPTPSVPEAIFEAMLQALLADRFHLVAHVESEISMAYVMTAPEGPGKLPQARAGCHTAAQLPIGPVCGLIDDVVLDEVVADRNAQVKDLKHIRANSITTADLAKYLSLGVAKPADLPVVDQTGITRFFDMDLAYHVAPTPALDANFASLQTALFEQYGLKLSPPAQLPLPLIVIDKVSLPTTN